MKDIDYDLLYADLEWEPLETDGSEDKGYCFDPYGMHKHGDTTGKLAINREKGLANCWVCGGFSLLSLAMAVKNISEEEAHNYLDRFSRPSRVSSEEFQTKIAKMLEVKETEIKPLPHFSENVIEKWVENNHEWFAQRGISPEIRRKYFVGFNPVARTFRKGKGTYEGPAIILPHFWEGKLLGWQSRWLEEPRPTWVSKYTNTSDFPREQTIWGLDFAKLHSKPIFVVESVPTALRLLSEDRMAVATFGSQITTSQLRHLRGFQQGVILAPDNDSPGKKWLQIAREYLERYIKVDEVAPVNKEGADLGDLSSEELEVHLHGF